MKSLSKLATRLTDKPKDDLWNRMSAAAAYETSASKVFAKRAAEPDNGIVTVPPFSRSTMATRSAAGFWRNDKGADAKGCESSTEGTEAMTISEQELRAAAVYSIDRQLENCTVNPTSLLILLDRLERLENAPGGPSMIPQEPAGEAVVPRPDDFTAGQLQHDCRTAIRDLIRLEGFERAREHVAMFLVDECDRSKRK